MLIGMVNKQIKKFTLKYVLLIFIPLVLSAFTHIWNPIGFPAIHVDEGHYMRRAMQVIEGQGPQESNHTYFYPYDHPYFGQLFLGGVLKLIGYPDILSPKVGDVHSIEMLYLVPRVIMGLLAVVDTFLIFKIAEHRYSRNIAFVAAILFAVMPLSLLTRGIFLDSILLPFLLSSILFAIYSKETKNIEFKRIQTKNLFVLLSGIFLGLAIFTKLPVFLMIPVVAYLVYTNSNNSDNKKYKKIKVLALWFIPVILIAMIWPAYATLTGHFDEWIHGVLFQASRESGKDLRNSINIIFQIDAVLLLLAFVAFIYSELRNSYFIFLWIVPYLIFLSTLGWVVHFHWILLIPAFCIAIGVLIEGICKRIKHNKVSQVTRMVIISLIGIFGLTSTYTLITSNLNSSYFELYSYISQDLQSNSKVDTNDGNNTDGITVIGTHRVKAILWIPAYVFDNKNIFFRDTDIGLQSTIPPIETKKVLLIVDNNLRDRLIPFENIGNEKDKQISSIYHNAETSATFINKEYKKYSYMTMKDNYGLGSFVEVRSNYN
jgi:4-amino-4-deoxy-L-arabinose transferase-like glycosyltransferase